MEEISPKAYFRSEEHCVVSSTSRKGPYNKDRIPTKFGALIKPDPTIKKWTYEDDKILKKLVVQEHEFNWDSLAGQLGASRSQVVRRWQESIYPALKVSSKIAGALKWSAEEDLILIES